ncbi:hypothetical protein Glove_680g26 [Diversispora epigaea]|uniref:Uncharacterized protein n=1 Tax=Diversispora epigaea TaxID=1348612 RepID=A0A397G454_9GLOM|nr:hypothetical protein Glove_680g26 [Diversispora epigaea]
MIYRLRDSKHTTATETQPSNNNLGLKIGLSVVGIIAIFLLGLKVMFLTLLKNANNQNHDRTVNKVSTSLFVYYNQALQDKVKEAQELENAKENIINEEESENVEE